MSLFDGIAEKLIDEDKLRDALAQLLSHLVHLIESLAERKKVTITIQVDDR